jgi:hypothetical protein
MIATMAMNLPAEGEENRTTLIVVPAALLQQARPLLPRLSALPELPQWKDEIETKTNDMFSVRVHHGKDKLKV